MQLRIQCAHEINENYIIFENIAFNNSIGNTTSFIEIVLHVIDRNSACLSHLQAVLTLARLSFVSIH